MSNERVKHARAAMQGMCACQGFINETVKLTGSKEQACADIARWAFMMADAMEVRNEIPVDDRYARQVAGVPLRI